MENQPYYGTLRTNPRLLIGAAIFVTLAVAIILFTVVRSTTRATDLLPILATPTAAQNGSDALSPITVTFRELNSNPLAYLNLPIQVSGSYMALDPPSCPRFSGPPIQWALVSEELQLDVKGFERVVRILEPGTDMTVQGIWRLYQGPLGCGKGPPSGSTWYLQAQRIVQPNPLVGDGSAGPIDIEGVNQGLPDLLPIDVATSTPLTQFMETPLATATVNQTDPSLTIEPTGTADGDVGVSPSLTPSFSTNTPVPGGNTPDPSPTADATATTGSGGENGLTATPLSPTATETPDSYPGPPATATPRPYPKS